ncbi:MAG: leucine-rich repeat domain-containing protein [Clostridia bacterium]|nr:leucine-rich repeat domain-containing protein [Clostridia bacterium]
MKNKTTKVLVLFLTVIFLCFSFACASERNPDNGGVGNNPSQHTHEYSIEYSKDEVNHWFECKCGDKKDITTHEYVDNCCKCGNYEPTYYTEGLVFELNEDNASYSVVNYNGDSKDVVIPSVYNEKPVTCIGVRAFKNCHSLTSIAIGCRITSIGDYAFLYCDSLTNIEFPDSVTSIGNGVFGFCYDLVSVRMSKNLTSIGDSAFSWCDSLTNIEIPNSVISIGHSAFPVNDNLIYNIENNLKYLGNENNKYLYLAGTISDDIKYAMINSNCRFIGNCAFDDCNYLTSIEIPNSVTSIDTWAFLCCGSLTKVSLGENLTTIGNDPFSSCISLISIEVAKSNGNYKTIDGNLYSKDGEILIRYAMGKTASSFTIPNCVTSIGGSAFGDCGNLSKVIISDSVTSIEDYAFPDWKSLTIYCETESKPIGWKKYWNLYCPVVWGYKG